MAGSRLTVNSGITRNASLCASTSQTKVAWATPPLFIQAISRSPEEIMNKASCLSLLSNAVLVWNTLRIAEIVKQLRATGHVIADQDLARVLPLMHAHVIPNGTYRFSDEEEPGRTYAAAS